MAEGPPGQDCGFNCDVSVLIFAAVAARQSSIGHCLSSMGGAPINACQKKCRFVKSLVWFVNKYKLLNKYLIYFYSAGLVIEAVQKSRGVGNRGSNLSVHRQLHWVVEVFANICTLCKELNRW